MNENTINTNEVTTNTTEETPSTADIIKTIAVTVGTCVLAGIVVFGTEKLTYKLLVKAEKKLQAKKAQLEMKLAAENYEESVKETEEQ